jgi:hypothetical protein
VTVQSEMLGLGDDALGEHGLKLCPVLEPQQGRGQAG